MTNTEARVIALAERVVDANARKLPRYHVAAQEQALAVAVGQMQAERAELARQLASAAE